MESKLRDRWRRWKASGIPWSVRVCWAASDVLSARWLAISLGICAVVLVLVLEIAAIIDVLAR